MRFFLSVSVPIFLFFLFSCPQPSAPGGLKPGVSDSNAFQTVRTRRVAFLTAVNSSTQVNYEQTAQKWAQSFNAQSPEYMLWNDLTGFEDGVQIQSAYERINAVALVYALKNSAQYKSAEYLELIKTGLDFLHVRAYNDQKLEKGNWWQWEIGIPKILNDILILTYGTIESEKTHRYLESSQFFQPDPRYNGASSAAGVSSSPTKRNSLGANLVDTAGISFLRGVLLENKEEVREAINALDGLNAYVFSGDGFYADGSFIQHCMPYTGSYAASLFDGLGSLLYLADGTEFDGIKNKMTVVYESILKSLPWLFINGGVTDAVSGRSVSRDNSSDLERGRALITSLALLAEAAPPQYRNRLRTLLKTAIKANTSYTLTDRVYNTIQQDILVRITNDAGINAQEPTGGKVFLGMDRAVYKAPSGGAFVVAMHSNRVGNFEIMNGENLKGWHSGDGMSYIYGKDSRAYTDFWPTVDPYHLAGTTESTAPRPDNPTGERRTAGKMSPAELVGGVASENALLVVMDFYSWNDNTRAKKSWFFADNLMVALGSGITSSDSGEIHTTIENRIASSFTPYAVSEGEIFEVRSGSDVFSYKLLSGSVDLNLSERNGSWRDIGGISSQTLGNRYFTAVINHGANPENAKYAYIAAPLVSKAELEGALQNISILRHDEKVHSIQYGDITAANFFADESCSDGIFTANRPCSLLAQKQNYGYELFVSAPTEPLALSITLNGNYSASSAATVTAKNENGKTVVTLANPAATVVRIRLYTIS